MYYYHKFIGFMEGFQIYRVTNHQTRVTILLFLLSTLLIIFKLYLIINPTVYIAVIVYFKYLDFISSLIFCFVLRILLTRLQFICLLELELNNSAASLCLDHNYTVKLISEQQSWHLRGKPRHNQIKTYNHFLLII